MNDSPTRRRYAGPFVLGLTGGIGMGKSWVASVFSIHGVPVFDSDKSVHKLLGVGGAAVEQVLKIFPGAVITKKAGMFVDRKKLGDIVFNDVDKLHKLELILHPLIEQQQKKFIGFHARLRTRLVVLDIPLLFETGGDIKTDLVACVYAPRFVQRARVMLRPGMNEARLQAIESNQLSAELKCQLADIVISTRAGRGESLRQVKEMIQVINKMPARAWGPHWGK